MLKHKIIGLDVGSKTVGIAISDLMGWTAQGLDTLRIDEEKNELGINQLVDIIQKEKVGEEDDIYQSNQGYLIAMTGRSTYLRQRGSSRPYNDVN